ncbi:MAG: hypothetical protein ABIZ52_04935 [Candidatus Limnocylindrales bacterium]
MAPLLLLAAGLVALATAAVILRSFGSGYRVGRLLAAAPRVSVAEAVQLAEAGTPGYVRIEGRIDSDAEFEDAHHRPLVLRRTTIEWRPAHGSGPWTSFDTRLEAVPFVIRDGLDEISVASERLADGLVTIARMSVGEARDIEELTAAGVAPDAQARLRVEQVSTVEHGTVLGVPVPASSGGFEMGPGRGRPLILSTLEEDEAMRVLAGGRTGRSRLAIACLALGVALVAAAALWWLVDALIGGGVATALAASPEPTLRPGTDTRSSGGGPGLVGDPLLALLGVLGIAAASLIASLAYVRLTAKGPRTGIR